MSSLSLRARHDHDRAVLSLAGELDLATVPSLRDAALEALSVVGCTALVLELAGLTFLDSTGLGCWIELRNRAEEAGQAFVLEAVPPTARRTVTIAGLAPLFGLDRLPADPPPVGLPDLDLPLASSGPTPGPSDPV